MLSPELARSPLDVWRQVTSQSIDRKIPNRVAQQRNTVSQHFLFGQKSRKESYAHALSQVLCHSTDIYWCGAALSESSLTLLALADFKKLPVSMIE